jgi:hypothetical protein
MAIALRSQSSLGYATRANSTVPKPATVVASDIVLMQFFAGLLGSSPPTPTLVPSGFTAFGTATEVIDTSGFRGQERIYWKRATASEPATYDFLHTTMNTEVAVFSLSGCLSSGTPIGPNTTNNSGDNGVNQLSTGLSITTTAAGSWLMYLGHNWSASAGAVPPGMTQLFNTLQFGAYELRATAGATGDRVQNPNGNSLSGANMWAARMIELLADAGGKTMVNQNGTWKEADTFVKHNGVWKPASTFVKSGGVWKPAGI